METPRGQRTFRPKNPEENRWKTRKDDSQYGKARPKPTFDSLLDKYVKQAAGSENRPREKRSRSPPGQDDAGIQQREPTRPRSGLHHEHHQLGPDVQRMVNPPAAPGVVYPMSHPCGPSSAPPMAYPQIPGAAYSIHPQMSWGPAAHPPPYPVWDPYYDMWVQYPPVQIPTFHPGWGTPHRSVFDRITPPVHDRLGPHQSGPRGVEVGVDQDPHRSDRSTGPVRPVQQGPQPILPDHMYSTKGKEKFDQASAGISNDRGKVATQVIKIGSNDVIMGDCFKGPVVIDGSGLS